VTSFDDFSPVRCDPDHPTSLLKNVQQSKPLNSDSHPNAGPEPITSCGDSAIHLSGVQSDPVSIGEIRSLFDLSNEAFGALLEEYRDLLRGLAKGQIGKGVSHRMSPSDIIQEAFVKVLDYRDQFHGTTEREFRSWLIRIFLSQVADALRRHVQSKSRGVKQEVRSSMELPENGGKTPSVIAVFNETVELLFRCFPKLTPREQEILTLRYWEKLSFDDIANRLNMPRSTVRFSWDRALVKLQKNLLKVS
jgi:RNA polymerase sigma-70 factor (ECF subfamily)